MRNSLIASVHGRFGNAGQKSLDQRIHKLYSQAKLGMMREALAKLDRQANERGISGTANVN